MNSRKPFQANAILFDIDVLRRTFLHEALQKRGIHCDVCYSLDKLRLLLERSNPKETQIFFPEPDRAQIELLSLPMGPMLFSYSEIEIQNVFTRDDYFRKWILPILATRKPLAADSIYDLVLIGSSTGGVPVVHEVIDQIDIKSTRIVLCQHISAEMSRELAVGLERRVKCPVLTIEKDTALRPGTLHVLAGRDFRLEYRQSEIFLVSATDPDGIYHPSFDLLAQSLLALPDGISSACVILSGLGNDGSRYLDQLKYRGVEIIAQDPSAAVASSMPSAAIQTGAVHRIYSSADIRAFLRKVAA